MKDEFWWSLAVVSAIAAVLIPLSFSFYLLIIFLSLVSLIMSSRNHLQRIITIIMGIPIIIVIMMGLIQADLTTAMLTALLAPVLFQSYFHVILSTAVLLFKMVFCTTLTSLIAHLIPLSFSQIMAPIFMMVVLSCIAIPRGIFFFSISLILSLIFTALAVRWEISPTLTQTISAIPIIVVTWFFLYKAKPKLNKARFLIITLTIIAFLTWLQDTPFSPVETVIILPESDESFESTNFEGLGKITTFVGLHSKEKRFFEIENLPEKTLVILPLTTIPIFPDDDWSSFKKLAMDRKWIVLIAAEHTNLGNNASRLNQLIKGIVINDDTTIPPGNTDISGHLRTSGLIPFPFNGILNRGASLSIYNPFTRVLIAGDGWFADSPNHYTSLSGIGDYLLDHDEQRGRIVLAASLSNGARWVFLGDNSLFINKLLVADPKPLAWIIGNVSLWPAFLGDLSAVIVILIVLFAYSIVKVRTISILLIIFGIITILSSILISYRLIPSLAPQWQGTFIGQSGFDDRNFNKSLVNWLLNVDENAPVIIRHRNGIDPKRIGKTNWSEIHFGLIKKDIKIGNIYISKCRRIGRINWGTINLMDAQSCKIDGTAEILIGTPEQAAAFRFKKEGNSIIVIFDEAFLANQSETSNNLVWLISHTQLK